MQQVPPLQFLATEDMKHLNGILLCDEEMHGRTGGELENRRPARMTLGDMKAIMTWITNKVEEAGAMEEVISLSSVDRMFAVVAGEFSEGEQNGQKKWNTLVRVLHSRRNVPVYFFTVCLQTLLLHYRQ